MEYSIALLVFALTASITPGPNNIMIMTSGLNFGIRQSMQHFLGICFGFPTMVLLVGIGFSVIFEMYPLLHLIIKLLGIIYLLYLAWKIATTTVNMQQQNNTKPLTFIQAMVFQWVNPKAWVMATGAISAYTSLENEVFIQVIYIAATFFLVAFPSVGTWLFFGVTLKRFLKEDKHLKIFNVTMAVLLIASITPVIVELLNNYIIN
jgi:threonine/homoserine/homoserine lactone efflux protein